MQTTRAYGLNNINYEKWNDVENIWELKSWQQLVKWNFGKNSSNIFSCSYLDNVLMKITRVWKFYPIIMTINYKQMTNLRNVRLSFNELPVVLLIFRWRYRCTFSLRRKFHEWGIMLIPNSHVSYFITFINYTGLVNIEQNLHILIKNHT